MFQRRVTQLTGFEEELAEKIASSFRFTHVGLKDLPLKTGRHLFVQYMPEVGQIEKGIQDPLLYPYDEEKEPSIMLRTESGSGLVPSSSGVACRHEWRLRIILRQGTCLEDAKALLEELVQYLYTLRGETGEFDIAGVVLESRPKPFQMAEDDHAYCEATLRFLVVPTT